MIPYAAIGIGIAVLLGVWAFLIAETVKERLVILGAPILVFLIPVVFRSRAGSMISLLGFMIYGLGCLIYLRFNGVGIR
jgi:hypothetical protein